jgi:hypothetical protein
MLPTTTIPMLAASDDNIIKFVVLGVIGAIVLVKWIIEQAQAQKSAPAKPAAGDTDQQSRAREIQRQMEEYRRREAAAREAAREAAAPRPRPARRPPAPPPPAPVMVVEAAPAVEAAPRAALAPSARPVRRRTLLGMPLNRRNVVRLVALSDVLATPAFKRDRI